MEQENKGQAKNKVSQARNGIEKMEYKKKERDRRTRDEGNRNKKTRRRKERERGPQEEGTQKEEKEHRTYRKRIKTTVEEEEEE